MRVLILNGSPRAEGNTSIAIDELVKTFTAEGGMPYKDEKFIRK